MKIQEILKQPESKTLEFKREVSVHRRERREISLVSQERRSLKC